MGNKENKGNYFAYTIFKITDVFVQKHKIVFLPTVSKERNSTIIFLLFLWSGNVCIYNVNCRLAVYVLLSFGIYAELMERMSLFFLCFDLVFEISAVCRN